MSLVIYIDLPSLVPEEENAILKKLVSVLKEYINVSKTVSNDILTFVSSNKDLNKITDAITSFLFFNITKNILIRLMNDLPLKSITDDDFLGVKPDWDDFKYLEKNGQVVK